MGHFWSIRVVRFRASGTALRGPHLSFHLPEMQPSARVREKQGLPLFSRSSKESLRSKDSLVQLGSNFKSLSVRDGSSVSEVVELLM